MNIKRLLIATLAVAVFSFIFGMLTCGWLFNWVYQLEPTNVWKSMENFPFALYIVSLLLVELIFVYVYALINKGIPGQNKVAKGALYGLIVWAAGLIPGMVCTYMFMTVATTVVIYWTIQGLVMLPLKGIIAASIYNE
ncbi:MAG: hypothetical protein GX568_03585 [Candidatus Gastranaerophilales bacterium]|nr:hypothetical protein [Candidatus Gastranaerophilales bacterium]